MQERDRRAFDDIGCAVGQRSQTLICGRQFAGQELTFGPFQIQREDQVMPALPAIVVQEPRASS